MGLLGSILTSLTSSSSQRVEEDADPVPKTEVSAATPAVQKRTMPARLAQVSSLLAGSALEEELSSSTTVSTCAPTTWIDRIVLSSEPDVIARSTLEPITTSNTNAAAIKRQKLIETPSFTVRDDTQYMSKTRGLRSGVGLQQTDLSDASYLRAHRKREMMEKRQRKAEIDVLTRDRRALLQRMEQLRTVEARMLHPILVARNARASTPQQQSSMNQQLEQIRTELLREAKLTLQRYDLLLSVTTPTKTVTEEVQSKRPRPCQPRRCSESTTSSLSECESDTAASTTSSIGTVYPTLAPTASLKVSASLTDLNTAILPPTPTLPEPPRSTRRLTLQAFGEKLPDQLSRSAHFDLAIMHYLRHIDKPQ